MATEERLPEDLVAAAPQLAEAAARAGFYPLVALLERLTAGAARVGEAGPPGEEAIRFRHDPALTFSTGDVSRVSLRESPERADDPFSPKRSVFEVVTTFLGLTGAITPLPMYMVEELVQEAPGGSLRRDFLDLFHHRLLSLLYRLCSKYDLAGEHTTRTLDRWSLRLLALAGLDAYEDPLPTTLPAWRLLRLLPLLATHARTARTLEVAIEDVLAEELGGARVTVQQFMGAWVEIEPDQRMRLGVSNCELGRTSLVGSRIYDRSGRFQVRIAPLTQQAYRRLLPEGDLAPVVREVVAVFVRDPIDYTLELGLARDEAPSFQLSRSSPCRLGRDTWLGSRRDRETDVQLHSTG